MVVDSFKVTLNSQGPRLNPVVFLIHHLLECHYDLKLDWSPSQRCPMPWEPPWSLLWLCHNLLDLEGGLLNLVLGLEH